MKILLAAATAGALATVAATAPAQIELEKDIIGKVSARLDPDPVVPGPGDPDGTGTAEIGIAHGHERLCFRLVVNDIEAATAAHIHRGGEEIAGPVVVYLAPPPTPGSSRGCVSRAGADLTREILTDPGGFYVDVHNAPFPGGALRGQLAPGPD